MRMMMMRMTMMRMTMMMLIRIQKSIRNLNELVENFV